MVKMESVSKNTIFGLKMMVKSGLENLFWNPFIREDSYFYYWICDFGHFYEVRESSLPYGGISKTLFLDPFSTLSLGQKLNFGYRFHFEGKTDVWISYDVLIVSNHAILTEISESVHTWVNSGPLFDNYFFCATSISLGKDVIRHGLNSWFWLFNLREDLITIMILHQIYQDPNMNFLRWATKFTQEGYYLGDYSWGPP